MCSIFAFRRNRTARCYGASRRTAYSSCAESTAARGCPAGAGLDVTAVAPPLVGGESEILKPYVPRLLIEWLRHDPAARYRPVDGSLAFVDISGFTALTERLARRGKIGAELMRDTLDGVFRALLDEAYDWGAGLLKWGGDALLLLFDGPGGCGSPAGRSRCACRSGSRRGRSSSSRRGACTASCSWPDPPPPRR
jgi:hypothetical protein